LAIKKQNLHPDLESQPQTKRLRISFDAFESRSNGYIGPVAALPGITVAQAVPADGVLASVSYWILSLLREIWESVVNLFQPDSAMASERQDEAAPVMSVEMSQESIPVGQVWKTYYYAGSQRVAMRVQDSETDEVYYLFGDHLGSTSITTDSNGNLYAELRYSAWGEVRYASGETPTDYTYTGQRSEVGNFGLIYYNARWYDPYLARFAQAVSREDWGALNPQSNFILGRNEGFYNPSDNSSGFANYSELYPNISIEDILDMVVIHHEGNLQYYNVNIVQLNHMLLNGWSDIGYHYVIGPDGTIYEGRDVNVRGAHVLEGNSGKIGILLLGDFEPGPSFIFKAEILDRSFELIVSDKDDIGPTQAQIESSLSLVQWLDFEYGIDQVVGHNALNDTECPGDYCLLLVNDLNNAVR
jgi:RHS repeat-associated protein